MSYSDGPDATLLAVSRAVAGESRCGVTVFSASRMPRHYGAVTQATQAQHVNVEQKSILGPEAVTSERGIFTRRCDPLTEWNRCHYCHWRDQIYPTVSVQRLLRGNAPWLPGLCRFVA